MTAQTLARLPGQLPGQLSTLPGRLRPVATSLRRPKPTPRCLAAPTGRSFAAWKAQGTGVASKGVKPPRLVPRTATQQIDEHSAAEPLRAQDSTQDDWNDQAFWDEILRPRRGSPPSVRLHKAFQKILNSPGAPSTFLLDSPTAFNAVLDGSLLHDDHLSRSLRIELCSYIFRQFSATKTMPPKDSRVYAKMMARVLKQRPSSAQLYHNYLLHVRPDEDEIASLVAAIAGDSVASRHFQQLCVTLPSTRTSYPQVISRLCRTGRLEAAYNWHKFLLENGCSPPNAESAEPLRAKLLKAEQHERLEELDGDVQKATLQRFVDHLENVFPQGKKSPAELSDSTLARGLATTFISTEIAIRALEFFGVSSLGPLALRQLVLRTADGNRCDLAQLRVSLDRLRQISIEIEDCVFNRLVEKLLREDRAEMLNEVATCDLHCDVFGDAELQFSLLARFDGAMDRMGVDRTMAILLTDTPKEEELSRTLNFQLRSCLMRDDRVALEHIFEQLQTSFIPIDFDCIHMMHSILRQRLESGHADHNIDATLISKIWMQVLDDGYFILAKHWKSALAAILSSGDLTQYEAIAFKLVKSYTSRVRPSRAQSTDGTGHQPQALWKDQDAAVRTLARRRLKLDLIFSMSHLADLVAYGFYFGRLQDEEGEQFARSAASVGRGVALASHPMLWGLRTALLLQARGVRISWERLTPRFQLFVSMLCGQGIEVRDGRTATALPGTTMQDYAEAHDILIRQARRRTPSTRHGENLRPVNAPGPTDQAERGHVEES